MEVNINLRNELFIDGEIVKLNDVKQIAIDFIDNAGGLDQNNTPCNWCKGKQLSTSSDHASKAFISVKTDRTANYQTYISVLDHLNAAYTHLRNRLGANLYNQNYESLLDDFKKSNQQDKSIAVKIKNLREKYPLLLSDADMQN